MFGRGQKDAEQAGLGSLSSGTAEPLTLGLPKGYSGSSPARRRQPSGGPSETPLLIVFMVLALVAVGALLVKLQNDDQGKTGAQSGSSGAISTSGGSTLVTGAGSYLQPNRLAAELRGIDRRVGGTARIVDLRLDGNSFNATYANADDNRVTLSKTANGSSLSTISIAVTSVVPSNRIDPRVPMRLVNAVRERTHANPQDIDYVVFSATFAKLGSAWSVFLNKGPAGSRQFVADINGQDLRHPGEQTAGEKRRQAQRTACLQRARNAQQAERCLT